MGNVFATASDWLASMRKSHAATSVTYCRGQNAIQICAQKMNVNIELDRGDGVTIETQRMDWIVAAGDLVFGGQPVEPTLLPIRFQNHRCPVRFRNVWVIDRGLQRPGRFPVRGPGQAGSSAKPAEGQSGS